MMIWQRRARAVIAVFGLLFGLAVLFAIRERAEGPPVAPVERLDPQALVESTGAVVIQARGASQEFTVEAERQLTYAGGATRLEDVKVTVLERAGRDFVVTGREAEVGDGRTAVRLSGDVRMAASDGLTAETDRASYDEAEGIFRAPDPLTFQRGGTSGSGVGATYDHQRDLLELLERARIRIAGTATSPATAIDASTARLAQRDGYARFEGSVRLVRGAQVMEADSALAHFTAGEMRLQAIELRGSARVRDTAGGPAGLETMQAQDINLVYDADERIERATLVGSASIGIGDGTRRIGADWIDLSMAPGGGTLDRLTARDRVELSLPGTAGDPARRIRAAVLDSWDETGGGLTQARFSGGVEFRETRPAAPEAAALDRTVRSTGLELRVTPGFGEVDEATFLGEASLEERELAAHAPEIRYAVAAGTIELAAPDGLAGEGPRLVDAHVTIAAGAITFWLNERRLVATGDVRSVLRPDDGTGGGHAEADVQVPAILARGEPVYFSARRLEHDAGTGRARYTGAARLWQHETTVQGDALELDQRAGNLAATGNVRSMLPLDEVDEETGARERVHAIATAGELVYDNAARQAVYSGSARVHGPPGDLTAARIELFLDEEGRGLDRVEGHDAVTLRDDRRTATGARLTYHAAGGRYLMRGTPVSIVEDCRETTGRALTFYRSTDTIAVDGNEEIRTHTTAGDNCP